MQRLLIPLALAVSLAACTGSDGDDVTQPRPFFDLRGYIEAETSRLEGYPLRVKKTITLNGVTETQELADHDFATDLRVFRESDINRNAWLDKYSADTQRLSATHRILTYQSLDSSLQTRSLTVEEDQGVVTRLAIKRMTGTVLSDGSHDLLYEPARGYRVRTVQENRFGEDVDALITVSW